MNKVYQGRISGTDLYTEGSVLYDADQDVWRIVEYFFDIESPRLNNQFGVSAPVVDFDTIEPVVT